MKWLILLILFLLLIFYLAYRYRRQLQTARQMYLLYKRMRQNGKQTEKQINQKAADKGEPLVRCERCGTWVPQSEALKLRSKLTYCSAKCMERAAKLQSMVD